MSNFSQMFQRPSGNTLTAIGLLDARITNFLNRGQALGLKPEAVVTTAGLLFVALVGWINYKATPGLNFEYVYLIGCSMVGWIAGARGGFLCTALASSLSFLIERGSADVQPLWLVCVNSVVRLLAF